MFDFFLNWELFFHLAQVSIAQVSTAIAFHEKIVKWGSLN